MNLRALLCCFLLACEIGMPCNNMFCVPLEVVVTGEAGAPLPDGSYEVTLVVDGKTDSLSCWTADPRVGGGWYCRQPQDTTDFDIWTIPDQAGSFTIQFAGRDGEDAVGPSTVEIDIVVDDVVVAHQRFDPDYETHVIGDTCGSCDKTPPQTIEIP